MKIAFCNRPTWNSPLGGDGVQMIKTKEYLEKLYGVEIDIVTDPELLSKDYDLIHIFNYVTWQITEGFFKKATELDIPIVSSSIYWDYTYAFDRLINMFIGKRFSIFSALIMRTIVHNASRILGKPLYFSNMFRQKLIYFMDNSKIILPNSIEEAELLQGFTKKNYNSKISIVYNAADKPSDNTSNISKEDFLKKYNIPGNYILQVGRIEPVKNQINLVYSLKDNPEIPIVFVGKISNEKYYNKIAALSRKRGNVYFINQVKHEEISLFYKFASIHVLLSLRESPGLVSLEALRNNCPIVISTKQYVPIKTYFDDQPYVVNPLNCEEIKNVILKAYKDRKLINSNIDKFTWEVTARQTYDAYNKVLSN